jgi:uncharacterized protein YecE (DUF72 family)
MQISIGCTGWGYDGWQGPFYPKNLAKSEFLKHYSSIFDITEINSTFYAIPNHTIARKWHLETPNHFKFTAKIPQIITHDARLANLSPHLEQFLQSMKSLGTKFLLSVVQLPPSMSFDEARPKLDALSSYFPENNYAIEGRHQSWFSDSAIQYLSDKRICLVWSDVAGIQNTAPLTSDFVYLRLIGDRTIPEKDFGKLQKDRTIQMKSWIDKLEKTQDKISYAVIMANNRYEGFGPATANKLRVLLGMEELSFSDKRQKTLFGAP